MKNWRVEEWLIEWLHSDAVLRRGCEQRLVSPQNTVVARRLALDDGVLYLMRLQGGQCLWWQLPPKPRSAIFVADVPKKTRDLWADPTGLVIYQADYSLLMRPSGGKWQLTSEKVEVDSSQCQSQVPFGFTQSIVRSYVYTALGQPITVEWCVCLSREALLLGQEIPRFCELRQEGHLVRRHSLIHIRFPTVQEYALFEVPRRSVRQQTTIGDLFSTPLSGFALPILDNG